MERSFTAVILDSATTTFQTPEMYESCLFLELKMWLYEKIYPGGLAARSGTEFPWSPQLRNSAEWDWVQIFLENKFGGECRHGRMTSFCSVLSFPAYKYQEKVSMNFFNGPLGHQEAWCMNSSWVTSLIVIRDLGKFSFFSFVNFRAIILLHLIFFHLQWY